MMKKGFVLQFSDGMYLNVGSDYVATELGATFFVHRNDARVLARFRTKNSPGDPLTVVAVEREVTP